MPQGRRKVPFSGKQKKQQIAAKRQAKSKFVITQNSKSPITTTFYLQSFSHSAMHRTITQTVKMRELQMLSEERKLKKSITKARRVVAQIVMHCNFIRSLTSDYIKCGKILWSRCNLWTELVWKSERMILLDIIFRSDQIGLMQCPRSSSIEMRTVILRSVDFTVCKL